MKTTQSAAISIAVLCICGCASTQQAYEPPTTPAPKPEPIFSMSSHTDLRTGVRTEKMSATGTNGEKWNISTTTTNKPLDGSGAPAR